MLRQFKDPWRPDCVAQLPKGMGIFVAGGRSLTPDGEIKEKRAIVFRYNLTTGKNTIKGFPCIANRDTDDFDELPELPIAPYDAYCAYAEYSTFKALIIYALVGVPHPI